MKTKKKILRKEQDRKYKIWISILKLTEEEEEKSSENKLYKL